MTIYLRHTQYLQKFLQQEQKIGRKMAIQTHANIRENIETNFREYSRKFAFFAWKYSQLTSLPVPSKCIFVASCNNLPNKVSNNYVKFGFSNVNM